MRKYYRRRKYSQGYQIKSFWDFIEAIIKIGLLLILLALMPYITPVYIFILQNPIFLIPILFIILLFTLLISWSLFWYIQRKKAIHYQAIQKFSEIMKLSPREFEEFVEDIFIKKWFETVIGKWTKDWWVDVTATLGDKKFFVQCKHYREENIGVEKIRELHGVMTGEIIPVWGIFVTTTWFTPDAVAEAHKYWIELWDRNYLIDYLKEYQV